MLISSIINSAELISELISKFFMKKNNFNVLVIVFSLLFGLLLSRNVYAINEEADSNYQLSVVTETWVPFNYKNEKNEVIGSSTEIVKSVLQRAEIPYEINIYPWNNSYNIARTQENVLIYSIFRSAVREQFFHWICPISSRKVINSVYKLSTRQDVIVKSGDNLSDYSINATRGSFHHELLLSKGMEEGVNLQLTSSSYVNVLMLVKNRVDLIVEVDETIYQMLEELNLPANTVEKVYTFDEKEQPEFCMAISKGTPQIIIDKIRNSHQKSFDK